MPQLQLSPLISRCRWFKTEQQALRDLNSFSRPWFHKPTADPGNGLSSPIDALLRGQDAKIEPGSGTLRSRRRKATLNMQNVPAFSNETAQVAPETKLS